MELERTHLKISTTAGTSPCSSPKAHNWAHTKLMNYPGVTLALKARASLKAQRGSKHVFAFIAGKARWRLRSSDRGPQGLKLRIKLSGSPSSNTCTRLSSKLQKCWAFSLPHLHEKNQLRYSVTGWTKSIDLSTFYANSAHWAAKLSIFLCCTASRDLLKGTTTEKQKESERKRKREKTSAWWRNSNSQPRN